MAWTRIIAPRPCLRHMYSARDNKDRSSARNMIYMRICDILSMNVLDTRRETCQSIPFILYHPDIVPHYLSYTCHTECVTPSPPSRCPRVPPYWPYLPAYWGQVMPYVSHTLMMLNSSANFAIYCLVGHTFRRELLRTLGIA